jgi:hypothetical protein
MLKKCLNIYFKTITFYTFSLIFLLLSLIVSSVQSEKLDESSYCSGVYNCLLEKPKSCNDVLCRKNPNIEYNSDFCEIFRRLRQQGLEPESFWGRRIYSLLSMQYRVTYMLNGSLPLSAPVMRYLMNHLSFSSQLVNAYQGTKYTIEYTNTKKTSFRGNNGQRLSGNFNIVLQGLNQLRNVYFGYGTTKILMWRLRGYALILFDYDAVSQDRINYRLTCIVSPSNRFIKSIINFILFRKVVLNILRENIMYIQSSAMEFDKGNVEPIAKYPGFNTPKGRKEIEEFQKIIEIQDASTCGPRSSHFLTWLK